MSGKRFLTGQVAIESFRDNGYTNTAYALAELIDNSIQAKASRVEIGFIEESVDNTIRKRKNVNKITVWDNGLGMSQETLQLAMEFGGSQNKNDLLGMGKFGMGLPNSSISQCLKVEVWSWQNNGPVFYTYLDVKEMMEGRLEMIPTPIIREIPAEIEHSHFRNREQSGTLIIWSNLDRINWKTGKSIYKHCELLVGRMYRYYLEKEEVKIDSVIYNRDGDNSLCEKERYHFRANDPLYLLKNTSLDELPDEYKNEAFFELYKDESFDIEYIDKEGNKQKSVVQIKSSHVKRSIVNKILENQTNVGNSIWGKHCSRNIGISILRSGRELVLKNLFLSKDLREYKGRFIGIEILFNPELDKVFGVTNNKQDSVNLLDYDFYELAIQSGFESELEYEKDLIENEDEMLSMRQIICKIKEHISELEKIISEIPTRRKESTQSSDLPPSQKASQLISHHLIDELDDNENLDNDDTTIDSNANERDEIINFLTTAGLTEDEAIDSAEKIPKLKGHKYWIEEVNSQSEAFFDVATHKSLTLVTFNKNHSYFDTFVSTLDDDQRTVMEIIIASFAEVMRKTTNESRRKYLDRVRKDWGIILNDWLLDVDDDDLV